MLPNNLNPSSLLPKQVETIKGMGEILNPISSMGVANFSIPLPISQGRDFYPTVNLEYRSNGVNSEYGIGWSLPLLSIKRNTKNGMPKYTEEDEFLGPDGQVIFPDTSGSREVNKFRNTTLSTTFIVTRYFSRIENTFNLIERWIEQTDASNNFWLLHTVDGSLQCLGKTSQARIQDSEKEENLKIAEWLLEESVSSNCDHIYYEYSPANLKESGNKRDDKNYKYITQIYYGYREGNRNLLLFQEIDLSLLDNWYFILQFDYSIENLNPQEQLSFQKNRDSWDERADPFSFYNYGFEIRIHCLCRQVFMYHNFKVELGDDPLLVKRLILGYRENPIISTLENVTQYAYGENNIVESLPPLDLNYNSFSLVETTNGENYQFTEFISPMKGLNNGFSYILIDLYRDGIPGVLYQSKNSWYYCAPQRKDDPQNKDAVSYSEPKLIQSFPSIQDDFHRLGTIIDYDGDGVLECFVKRGVIHGYIPLKQDGAPSRFIPIPSFPIEASHPYAKWVDLTNNGAADIVFINSKGVRLYPNNKENGFGAGVDVPYLGEGFLPAFRFGARNIVTFSNIISSGSSSNLIEILYNQVTCWPSLGNGKFGSPVILPISITDNETSFDPKRLYIADLDNSGLADIIYFESELVKIYLNQSGNKFLDIPIVIFFPDGVNFDDISNISFADIFGVGTTSLVFTVTHMDEKHYVLNFSKNKPYLLNNINTNMGLNTALEYRSSAQYWLDEKKQYPNAISDLPFPIYLVGKSIITDEVRQNKLEKIIEYKYGNYDKREKEFYGFGLVIHKDSELDSQGNEDENTPALETRNWYHTGTLDNEKSDYVIDRYFKDEKIKFNAESLLTEFKDGKDTTLSPDNNVDDDTIRQLHRGLKGRTLRTEIYGLSRIGKKNNDQNTVPYTTTSNRYMVRLQERKKNGGKYCVVLPSILETLSCSYDQILADPMISHNVLLQSDEFGAPTHEVVVNYPRCIKKNSTPYYNLDIIPQAVVDDKTTWESSFDDAQYILRIKETKRSFNNTSIQDRDDGYWRLFIPDKSRKNIIEVLDAFSCDFLSYEKLTSSEDTNPLLIGNKSIESQEKYIYSSTPSPNFFFALLEHVETLEFPSSPYELYKNINGSKESIDDFLATEDLFKKKLTSIGYEESEFLFPSDKEKQMKCWIAERSFATYGEENQFFKSMKLKTSVLSDWTEITYDDSYCFMISIRDPLANETNISYDYKLLAPKEMTDLNNNTHITAYDSLGRNIATSFYGQEDGKMVGFTQTFNMEQLNQYSITDITGIPLKVLFNDEARSQKYYASVTKYNLTSWMGKLSAEQLSTLKENKALWQVLLNKFFITQEGFLCSKAYYFIYNQKNNSDPDINTFIEILKTIIRIPVHSSSVLAENYEPTLPRITVTYFDGVGRIIQSSMKAPNGNIDDPSLIKKETSKITALDIEKNSSNRWLISGRVTYNNKGLMLRKYQPFFLNTFEYVMNFSPDGWNFPTTFYYDALGRTIKTVDALGYIERVTYYPWIKIMEDKNDTYEEAMRISVPTNASHA